MPEPVTNAVTMTAKPAEDPAAAPTDFEPGFHVILDGQSLGCYPTAADAEAFADGHPRANGLTVTVIEVAA